MPKAVLYVAEEGDNWKRIPEEVYINSLLVEEFERGYILVREQGLVFHALFFDDGRIWDSVNGFRKNVQRSLGEVMQAVKEREDAGR